MKKFISLTTAAALLLNLPVQPAAADDIMNLRMAAAQTAFSTDTLAAGDARTSGALYIDNYSGISQLRLMLQSDAPLLIENGDFTRDSTRTEADGSAKLAFFAEHSYAVYTQYSEETGKSNVILWYGKETGESGGNYYAPGEIDLADSSFLSFDIRIPQDTPIGDYLCGISTDVKQITDTLTEADSYLYLQRQQQQLGTDYLVTPVKLAVYRRGDVNCDGEISITDVQAALSIYVYEAVLEMNLSDSEIGEIVETKHGYAARHAADASENGSIQINDPMGILEYYVMEMTAGAADWNDIY